MLKGERNFSYISVKVIIYIKHLIIYRFIQQSMLSNAVSMFCTESLIWLLTWE